MDQPTRQPASQPIAHPANQPASQPRKKKRHIATWIALASAATAIAAAALSGLQVNLAGKQNTEAEQQQLVSLTSLIGQQFAQQGSSSTHKPQNTLTGESVAANADQAQVAEFQVEGQAGAVLIEDLNGAGVAAIEYVEVARALADTADVADAIRFYKDALTAPPNNAPTRAEALRFLGGLYYTIGRYANGHYYELQAAKVFGKHFQQSRSYVANNIAQAYLADAYAQLAIKGCPIAAADVATARRILGPYVKNSLSLFYLSWDVTQYSLKCSGSG